MIKKKILPVLSLRGKLRLGGDKSISHRAIILGSLSGKPIRIKGFYPSQDCIITLKAMRALGVKIKRIAKNELNIYGVGLSGLKVPRRLFLANSGTTFRLLAGLLSGIPGQITIQSARFLSRRPMKRIVEPLLKMGAEIKGRQRRCAPLETACSKRRSLTGLTRASSKDEVYPPLLIRGGKLKGIKYSLPIASAQVKSAILLAGINARGSTRIIEKIRSRDHSERMLKLFGARISRSGNCIKLCGSAKRLNGPARIVIPGDFSSATFFIVAALLLKGSNIVIKNVGINPTRTGLLRVLKRMKADIRIKTCAYGIEPYEPEADIIVKFSQLQSTQVSAKELPLLIDEVPILMVAASLAKGTTRINGAGELRVKETDRIVSMCYNLRRMGVNIKVKKTAQSEDILIKGVPELQGVSLKTFSDHRTAMALVIAALVANKPSSLDDISCIAKSFPDFFAVLDSVKVVKF